MTPTQQEIADAARLCSGVGILVAENSEQPGLDVRKAAALIADVRRQKGEEDAQICVFEKAVSLNKRMDMDSYNAACGDCAQAIRARLEEGK